MSHQEPAAPAHLVAAVEAGGTKFRVAIAQGRDILVDTAVRTTTPDATMEACLDFICSSGYAVEAVGIACFGPVDLDPGSSTYGSITATPKPGWSNTDVTGRFYAKLGVPVGFDVDVGGAALGEWRWGAARGLDSFVYLTVGTGIGGGAFINGRIHHGLGHPEMGHVAVTREPEDEYGGYCSFHRSCLEGMACGPAIEDRWGARPEDLQDRRHVWDLEARYLAQGLRTITYVVAPERIVLGGGVMHHEGLLDKVREHLATELSGYTTTHRLQSDLSHYVVSPHLGQDAGLWGAVALAQQVIGSGGDQRAG